MDNELFCLYCTPTAAGRHHPSCRLFKPLTNEEAIRRFGQILGRAADLAGLDGEAIEKLANEEMEKKTPKN